ncbi:MAG: hypothetical protein K0S07_1700 [Chlamydiales bacterium]|jgi:glycine/D-amino acid oxidase-like deaminating enzyme|nr:hypothetical protein [Chlamydiales bacterium]
MKCAILGAGFAGCSAAHFLSEHATSITVFDPMGLGQASSVAAGSLHPFTGVKARLSWLGRESFAESKALIELSEEHSKEPVILSKGLLRLALSEWQQKHFQQSAIDYPENRWLEIDAVQQLAPHSAFAPALHIPEALAIDCRSYLKSLQSLLEQKNVRFEKKRIEVEEALKDFDVVILATGAALGGEAAFQRLNVRQIKGQILLFDSQKIGAPHCLLSSEKYLAPHPSGKKLIGGASFERNFASAEADLAIAEQEILPRLKELYPPIAQAPIIDCQAALRAYRPNKLPVVGRWQDRLYVFSGLGSKGLLYHALLGRQLAKAIVSNDLSHIPQEVGVPVD